MDTYKCEIQFNVLQWSQLFFVGYGPTDFQKENEWLVHLRPSHLARALMPKEVRYLIMSIVGRN